MYVKRGVHRVNLTLPFLFLCWKWGILKLVEKSRKESLTLGEYQWMEAFKGPTFVLLFVTKSYMSPVFLRILIMLLAWAILSKPSQTFLESLQLMLFVLTILFQEVKLVLFFLLFFLISVLIFNRKAAYLLLVCLPTDFRFYWKIYEKDYVLERTELKYLPWEGAVLPLPLSSRIREKHLHIVRL